MLKRTKNNYSKYQLRHAAGRYYLLDMEQNGVPYKRPMELNGIGTEIWELMLKGHTCDEIIQKIAEEYEVNIEDVREDVIRFRESLTTYGVIIGE